MMKTLTSPGASEAVADMTAVVELRIEHYTGSAQSVNAMLDQYVTEHVQGSIYHLTAWRQAIRLAYGHQDSVLIAKQNQTVVGLLPLSLMSLPLRGKQLVALPFADFCDVLADSPQIYAQLENAARSLLLAGHAKKLAVRSRVVANNISNNSTVAQSEANDQLSDDVDSDTSIIANTKVRMLVRLPESAEVLLASYKPKLRSQIKKAQKNGLSADISTSAVALEQFYAVYAKNMHRLGSPVHSFNWFIHLTQLLAPQQAFKIVLVSYQQQVVGAALLLHYGKQAWIPWASTLADFNHLAPNMLLYWHIQAYLADQGISTFDMGRSTYGEGTYRFKAQWGAEPEVLCWQTFDTVNTDGQIDLGMPAGRLRLLAEKTWRLLPLPVATTCGAFLRRYISL